jgi:hypothetical protein
LVAAAQLVPLVKVTVAADTWVRASLKGNTQGTHRNTKTHALAYECRRKGRQRAFPSVPGTRTGAQGEGRPSHAPMRRRAVRAGEQASADEGRRATPGVCVACAFEWPEEAHAAEGRGEEQGRRAQWGRAGQAARVGWRYVCVCVCVSCD